MSGFRVFGGLGFIGIEKGLAPRVLTESLWFQLVRSQFSALAP